MSLNWFRHMWLAWGVFVGVAFGIALVWFAIIEGIAIKDSLKGNTLSEVVWSLDLPVVLYIIAGGTLVALQAITGCWLIVHFASKGRLGI